MNVKEIIVMTRATQTRLKMILQTFILEFNPILKIDFTNVKNLFDLDQLSISTAVPSRNSGISQYC